MSWVRWGSPCSFLAYPWVRWCHEGVEFCPGSNVYVFENTGGYIECCGCSLERPDAMVKTEAEMEEHLRRHVAAGHHVPRILYDPEVIARAEAFCASMSDDERMTWYWTAMHTPGRMLGDAMGRTPRKPP